MIPSPLQPPWDRYTPEAVLAHFQSRTNVHYFPVLDAEQAGPQQIAALLTDRFCFNAECYHLPAGFDWRANPSQDVEWLILLHKFYYAVGLGHAYHHSREQRYLDKWIELTTAWINTVPLDFLSSDVMGRRVQNWVYAYHYFI